MSSSGPPTYPKPVLVSSQRAPGVPTPLPAPVQSQPKTIKLRCQALASLPARLLNPPAARGQVPTFSVIPRFEISLDDILDRKHLPPLGLKDFEEWLLFVEQSAENLYFILWLREYTQNYVEWVRKSRLARMSSHNGTPRREYRTPKTALPANPELSYSYSRAKRTFLTPNGDYELDVPSDVLAPFHTSSPSSLAGSPKEKSNSEHAASWSQSQSTCVWSLEGHNVPPPDPAVFDQLADAVREMLTESLQRFVLATYNNVGTPRAVCGSAGGIVIGLAGSIPLIVNFAVHGNRWWRLAAIPGMWAGLTIFISAMYGVCMMIYVFGDLRQLRSFELVRPPISNPQPHPSPSGSVASLFQPRPVPDAPIPIQFNVPFRRPRRQSSVPEISNPIPLDLRERDTVRPEKPKLTIITPPSRFSEDSQVQIPQRVVTRPQRSSQDCDIEVASVQYTDEDDGQDSGYEDGDERSECHAPASAPCIEISEAFYDEHPAPEGPATASFPVGRPPLWPDYDSGEEAEATSTAAFIHPFSYDIKGEAGDDVEAGRSIAARQPVDPFDFDALPPRRPRFAAGRHRGQARPAPEDKASGKPTKNSSKISGVIHSVDKYLSLGPKGVLSRWQTRCSPGNVVRVHIEREINGVPVCVAELEKEKGWGVGWGVAADSSDMSPTGTLTASAFTFPNLVPSVSVTAAASPTSPTVSSECYSEKAQEKEANVKMGWTVRFRKVRAVPAFAVPLTPVLNPVVTRAQWEIVVRSALIAALVVCVVVGGLTGAPVPP